MGKQRLSRKQLVELLVLWEQHRWESAQLDPRPCTPICMGCSAREAGRVPGAAPALGWMGVGPGALPINPSSGLCAHCERVAGLRAKDDFEEWELDFFRSNLKRDDRIMPLIEAQRAKERVGQAVDQAVSAPA